MHSQVLNDRRLENEERELADKFQHHKQLSLREYNKAHHDMQKDIQSQITELTLQQKSELEHLHRHTGAKIEYVSFYSIRGLWRVVAIDNSSLLL